MTDLTPERLTILRGMVATSGTYSTCIPGRDLRALLDAAEERDRLAGAVARVRALADYYEATAHHVAFSREIRRALDSQPVPRVVPGVVEHGDKPCLIGATHPASDPCEYPCPATMPGHRCTRLEHAEGGHLWAMTNAEWERLLAEVTDPDAHAYLPITEDADGLTCDICGAELADWAAADDHYLRCHDEEPLP